MKRSVFSKRHARALREKALSVSIPRRVRGRIRKTMEAYDESYYYQPDPGDNWREPTTIMEQAELELCRIEGVDKLEALDYDSNQRHHTDLTGYIDGAYPDKVLDAIEVFHSELGDAARAGFRNDINQIFTEEEAPWRLLDEIIVKLDTSMLDGGVTDHAVDLLKAMNVEGALEEFRDALDELTEGDAKDAIHDACNSFESVLKAITDGKGSATDLINSLLGGPLLNDLPEDEQKAMRKVLQALPILGNKLGRHGQGADVVDVHPRYGQLAVHLAGAYIIFVLDAYSASMPKPEPEPEPPETLSDWGPDEAPF